MFWNEHQLVSPITSSSNTFGLIWFHQNMTTLFIKWKVKINSYFFSITLLICSLGVCLFTNAFWSARCVIHLFQNIGQVLHDWDSLAQSLVSNSSHITSIHTDLFGGCFIIMLLLITFFINGNTRKKWRELA